MEINAQPPSTTHSPIPDPISQPKLLEKLSEIFTKKISSFEECYSYLNQEGVVSYHWELIDKATNELSQLVDEKGCSLLVHAINKGDSCLSEKLINHGIALRGTDMRGNTALHIAAKKGELELINQLKTHLDVNSRNTHGKTPLHKALKTGQSTAVQTLVDNGADITQAAQLLVRKKSWDFENTKNWVETSEAAELWYSHAQCLKESKNFETLDWKQKVAILEGMAEFRNVMGFYRKALEVGEQALTIRKEALGSEHSEVALGLSLVGQLCCKSLEYAEGEKYFKQAIEIQEKTLGHEHLDLVKSLHNLGMCYTHQGSHEESFQCYTRVIEIQEKALGKEHPDLIKSRHYLGRCMYHRKQYAEAIEHERQLFEMGKAVLGTQHPLLAEIADLLAYCFEKEGAMDDAFKFYKIALQNRDAAFEKGHPEIAKSFENLGKFYYSSGSYEDALKSFAHALSIITTAFGDMHPFMIGCLENLAKYYASQKNYKEALVFYQGIWEIIKKSLGEKHPTVVLPLCQIGLCYANLEGYSEAETCYKQAVAILLNASKASNQETLIIFYSLTDLYCRQKRTKGALVCLEQIVVILETNQFEKGPKINALKYVGKVCSSLKEYEKAIEIYEKALALLKETPEEYHELKEILYNLGKLCAQKKAYGKAIEYFQKLYEFLQQGKDSQSREVDDLFLGDVSQNLGNCHFLNKSYPDALKHLEEALCTHIFADADVKALPKIAKTLFLMAECHFFQNSYDNAIKFFQKLRKVQESLTGPNHQMAVKCLERLAACYFRKQQYKESLELIQNTIRTRRIVFGLVPELAHDWFNQGQCQRLLNQKSGALRSFQSAHDIALSCFGENHPKFKAFNEELEKEKAKMK